MCPPEGLFWSASFSCTDRQNWLAQRQAEAFSERYVCQHMYHRTRQTSNAGQATGKGKASLDLPRFILKLTRSWPPWPGSLSTLGWHLLKWDESPPGKGASAGCVRGAAAKVKRIQALAPRVAFAESYFANTAKEVHVQGGLQRRLEAPPRKKAQQRFDVG